MSCICTWKIEVPLCAETITIETDLSDGNYKLVIKDKFSQLYTSDITVYGGSFTIDLTEYTDGLFNIYGKYLIQVFDGCDLQIIGNCETEYKEIELTFVNDTTTETEITVCCN